MLDPGLFEGLVDQIYEAAVYPEKWSSTLHNLSMVCQSVGGIILLRRSDNWIGWRFSEGMRGVNEYLESDAPARSTSTERLLKDDRAGFLSAMEVFTDEEYRADSLITEWAMPNNLYHAAATAIKATSSDLVVVQMQREQGREDYSPADLALLDSFRPHLARAGLLAVRLQFEKFAAATRALGFIGLPAIILSQSGRVLCANDLAQNMPSHICWLPNNQMAFLDGRANERFRQILINGADKPGIASASFPVGGAGGEAAVAHMIPVASTARDFFEGGIVVLVVSPIQKERQTDTGILQGLFDLTAAEAEIAAQIGMGWSLEKIGHVRGSSLETVRSQVKAIFSKTNTGRQSELASLLSGIPQFSKTEQP